MHGPGIGEQRSRRLVVDPGISGRALWSPARVRAPEFHHCFATCFYVICSAETYLGKRALGRFLGFQRAPDWRGRSHIGVWRSLGFLGSGRFCRVVHDGYRVFGPRDVLERRGFSLLQFRFLDPDGCRSPL